MKTDASENEVEIKQDEAEILMWWEKWEKANDIKDDFEKYQKTIYPLIKRQHSPAQHVQLEGAKGYKK